MLVPSIFGENLFDDWFDADFPQWPEFRDLDRAERKLYGRHADRLIAWIQKRRNQIGTE